MSLAVVTPINRPKPESVLDTLFVKANSPFILMDYRSASRHLSDSHYKLTVTPKRFVVRVQRPSSLYINLNKTGVTTQRLMKLYEDLKPEWVSHLVFGEDTIDDHVWMLTVDIRID